MTSQQGGASQAVTVGTEAKVTKVGQTTLKEWQKLPSKILADWCKTQKRPRPIHKMAKQKGLVSYKVILPDLKKRERDLIFCPKEGVSNEEQALQEACLLALLQTSPSLPYERSLPEPYRTTWLNAIKFSEQKTYSNERNSNNPKSTTTGDTATYTSTSTESASSNSLNGSNDIQSFGAQSNLNLVSKSSFSSVAERRKKAEFSRQKKNTMHRKREALEMVNKDLTIFMSSKVRQEIETFLRLDTQLTSNEDANTDHSKELDKNYEHVTEYLQGLGFSLEYSTQSYRAVTNHLSETQRKLSDIKEECLQWLCINLEEDQLPKNFDPRGRTLDVMTYTNEKGKGSEKLALYEELGISKLNAKALIKIVGKDDDRKCNLLEAFAEALRKCSTEFDQDDDDVHFLGYDENIKAFEEEKEILHSIFGDECTVIPFDNNNNRVLVEIKLIEWNKLLKICVEIGSYPSKSPCFVYIYGGNWKGEKGIAMQYEMISYLSKIPKGEAMIYSIFMHATQCLECEDNLLTSISDLLTQLRPLNLTAAATKPLIETRLISPNQGSVVHKPTKPKRSFWTIPFDGFPGARKKAHISQSITLARQKLPAAKAKSEFFGILQKMENTGRVCLCTGDTGCGKVSLLSKYQVSMYR